MTPLHSRQLTSPLKAENLILPHYEANHVLRPNPIQLSSIDTVVLMGFTLHVAVGKGQSQRLPQGKGTSVPFPRAALQLHPP